MRHNGSEAVGVVVAMTKGANVLELGKQLKDAIARCQNAEFRPASRSTRSRTSRASSRSRWANSCARFVEALAIVLVVSFVSLGWRSGLVVATSVPLVLAVVFVVMNVAGLDLDRITLGSLIIALGLLVDDAIIAVEMMVVKMEQGWSRVRAAAFAWDSTAFPMLTGTLVTAAGFLPVGIAKFDSRRVCRQHLLDRRARPRLLVDRGGVFHAVSRREAAAQLHQATAPGMPATTSTIRAFIAPCAAPSAGRCASAGWSSP